MDHATSLLTDIGLAIIFATVAAHFARLLRQPLILGYVLGGVLLGSHVGFGLVTAEASIELISEIGLILLLFIIGLEIDLRELARMGRPMFVLGLVQFAACLAFGLGFFALLGFRMGGGSFDLLYLAVAFSLSSTLIVVKLLHDKFELHTTSGRLTIGILVLQDVWAIAFMAFQPTLLDPGVTAILRSIVQGFVLVLLAFLASRTVLSRVFHAVARSPELVLLSSIAWCFVVCGAADRAGLSKEMGALIAGLSISAFPYGTDVTAKLAGVRDFFVTLFFVSLGLKVPAPSIADVAVAALAVSFVIASRVLSVAPASYFLGMGSRNGLVTALNLSQVSEFSLVILSLGAAYRHVSTELQTFVLNATLLASVASTYLILFNDAIARALLRLLAHLGWKDPASSGGESAQAGDRRDIVVLGAFREGLGLLDAIEMHAADLVSRVLVVDFNPHLQDPLGRRGFRWAYGDLAHPLTLQHLGIEQARLVVCTISDIFLKGTTNRKLLFHLRQLAPQATLVMTADDRGQAELLRAEGAHEVVLPPEIVGERLLERLRETLGGQ